MIIQKSWLFELSKIYNSRALNLIILYENLFAQELYVVSFCVKKKNSIDLHMSWLNDYVFHKFLMNDNEIYKYLKGNDAFKLIIPLNYCTSYKAFLPPSSENRY